jgi:hypothetical protein
MAAFSGEIFPSSRGGHVFTDGLLVGGYDDTGPLQDIYMLDESCTTWKQLPISSALTPLPRIDFDGALCGQKFFLFGGMQSDGVEALILNDLWEYDISSSSWVMRCEECVVSERMGHTVTAISEDKFVVYGGDCMGQSLGDLWLYNVLEEGWVCIYSYKDDNDYTTPMARSSHSACYIASNNHLAIYGGYTLMEGEPCYMNDLWLLNMDITGEVQWHFVEYSGICPSPRDLPILINLPHTEHLLIMGGFGECEVETEAGTNEKVSSLAIGDNNGEENGDGEGTGEEGVMTTYLNDSWTIDVGKGEWKEVTEMIRGIDGEDMWITTYGSRGSKAAVYASEGGDWNAVIVGGVTQVMSEEDNDMCPHFGAVQRVAVPKHVKERGEIEEVEEGEEEEEGEGEEEV